MRVRNGSRPRRWHLALAAALGAAIAITPAIASFATEPTISAAGSGYSFYWNPATAEVHEGGTVAFQNSSTVVKHGVVWTGGPATPTCAGVPVFKAVGEGGETKWSGTCTFAKAGTYTFYCSVHGSEMSGTITVAAGGTTTTSPPSPPTTTTTNTTPTPSPEPPLGVLKLAKSQRGGSVKGSIDVSKAGVGDRLEVDVLATNASLAKSKHPGRVRVGRFVRNSVAAGMVSFSVKLDSKARRALKRRHRLALTIEVTLTPAYGEALTIARSVVQRG